MKWMDDIIENREQLELIEDEQIKKKLEDIDSNIKQNLFDNLEQDRLREQKTLEMSRQYYLG